MSKSVIYTEFAPAERGEAEVVLKQYNKLSKDNITVNLIKGFPQYVVILNKYRQIVLANSKFLELVKLTEKEILGLRPGEALGCIYSRETEGGCGTTRFCRYCGAVKAILNSQNKLEQDVQECKLLSGPHSNIAASNLRVWATPFELEEEKFTIFAVNDISDEKLRLVLEKIFFHDVLNTAGGIQGIMELLPDLEPEEKDEFYKEGHSLSKRLVSEIRAQRDLSAAERGDLTVELKEINLGNFFSNLSTLYRHHPVGEGKIIEIDDINDSEFIKTDEILLNRVLGNLLKNALEASEKGQKVKIAYKKEGRDVIFSVHNEKVMPEAVRLQMFKRYFTTKSGKGHGIGTYSVKLITEKYLEGKVDFSSLEGEGTTFTVKLPIR